MGSPRLQQCYRSRLKRRLLWKHLSNKHITSIYVNDTSSYVNCISALKFLENKHIENNWRRITTTTSVSHTLKYVLYILLSAVPVSCGDWKKCTKYVTTVQMNILHFRSIHVNHYITFYVICSFHLSPIFTQLSKVSHKSVDKLTSCWAKPIMCLFPSKKNYNISFKSIKFALLRNMFIYLRYTDEAYLQTDLFSDNKRAIIDRQVLI